VLPIESEFLSIAVGVFQGLVQRLEEEQLAVVTEVIEFVVEFLEVVGSPHDASSRVAMREIEGSNIVWLI
jgi:hypothetical protein